MTTLTETAYPGEFIVSEPDTHISRGPGDVDVTVPASTILYPGRVMAQLSATGKWVPYDNVGTDGSEEAAGILNTELDNTATASPVDFTAVMIQRFAAVRKSALSWNSGASAGDKTAAYADLASRFIVAFD